MNYKKILVLSLFLLCCFSVFATKIAPVPSSINHAVLNDSKQLLFYIQRSNSANTVVYDVNFTPNGTIAHSNPIDIYWLRLCCNGERKELNYIQKAFAYGLKTTKISDNELELKFVSTNKITLYLQKSALSNQYVAFTQVNGTEMELTRIYIDMEDGKSIWVPSIQYVLIEGFDPVTGQKVVEKILP